MNLYTWGKKTVLPLLQQPQCYTAFLWNSVKWQKCILYYDHSFIIEIFPTLYIYLAVNQISFLWKITSSFYDQYHSLCLWKLSSRERCVSSQLRCSTLEMLVNMDSLLFCDTLVLTTPMTKCLSSLRAVMPPPLSPCSTCASVNTKYISEPLKTVRREAKLNCNTRATHGGSKAPNKTQLKAPKLYGLEIGSNLLPSSPWSSSMGTFCGHSEIKQAFREFSELNLVYLNVNEPWRVLKWLTSQGNIWGHILYMGHILHLQQAEEPSPHSIFNSFLVSF